MEEKVKKIPPLEPEINPADADHSEERPGPFSELNNDDGIPYDGKSDDRGDLEKKRIHDK